MIKPKTIFTLIFVCSILLNIFFIHEYIYNTNEDKARVNKDNQIAMNTPQSKKVINGDTFDVKPAFRDTVYLDAKMDNPLSAVTYKTKIITETDTIVKYIDKSSDSLHEVQFSDIYNDEGLSFNFDYTLLMNKKDSIYTTNIISNSRRLELELESGIKRHNDTLYSYVHSPSNLVKIKNLNGIYRLETTPTRRWGVGINISYTYNPFLNSFQPAVGIGINYNILTLKNNLKLWKR